VRDPCGNGGCGGVNLGGGGGGKPGGVQRPGWGRMGNGGVEVERGVGIGRVSGCVVCWGFGGSWRLLTLVSCDVAL
jgi:hypothetical protein